MAIQDITLLVPCYNEEAVLPAFYERVCRLAENDPGRRYAFLFVNDGSKDGTAALLDGWAEEDPRIQVLHLARNRGHQMAITAGMEYARGDLFVIIDADLQDPPELVPQMVEKAEQGYQVIHAQRTRRPGESPFKLFTAWLFYKLMALLSTDELIDNCGDFRAFTPEVRDAMRAYPEPHRFMRGLFVDVGFRQTVLTYDRDPRFAGETHYPFSKMARLAANALFSFSSGPLRLITYLGIGLWTTSLLYLARSLYYKLTGVTEPGWTSIIFLVTFFSGIQLFCLGVIGAYIGRIFEQGQRRPLYWVAEKRNLPD